MSYSRMNILKRIGVNYKPESKSWKYQIVTFLLILFHYLCYLFNFYVSVLFIFLIKTFWLKLKFFLISFRFIRGDEQKHSYSREWTKNEMCGMQRGINSIPWFRELSESRRRKKCYFSVHNENTIKMSTILVSSSLVPFVRSFHHFWTWPLYVTVHRLNNRPLILPSIKMFFALYCIHHTMITSKPTLENNLLE